ncbi:MAG: hypothetical protein GQ474_08015 [Sulfurimonas sp.]|nr:hypothetical protein [Sulfurimonas sp.]
MRSKLKLFIWTNFSPDWSGGLAFALAATEQEARSLIIEDHGYNPSDWGHLEIRRTDWRVARSVSGGS